MSGSVWLMYHELRVPGRPLRDESPGYARYCVAVDVFTRQLAALRAKRRRGVNVTQALRADDASAVAITFDDGCATDQSRAWPALVALGFGATFYVTSGNVGTPGAMDRAALRALSDAGGEIGAHGATHRYLTELSDAELREELVGSRAMLEDITGQPVVHMSCPGGRVDARVVRAARDAGYTSVATSRAGTNRQRDRWNAARLAVTTAVDDAAFVRMATGRGLWVTQVRGTVLDLAKQVLGTAAYERLRRKALE